MINAVITISGYEIAEQPTINITTLDQLIGLRDRLNQVIAQFGQPSDMGTYISGTFARKLAKERGVNMNDSTLISACQRGVIPSARKNGKQWEFLASDFDSFLRRLYQKQAAHRGDLDFESMRKSLQEARQVGDISFEEFGAELVRA